MSKAKTILAVGTILALLGAQAFAVENTNTDPCAGKNDRAAKPASGSSAAGAEQKSDTGAGKAEKTGEGAKGDKTE